MAANNYLNKVAAAIGIYLLCTSFFFDTVTCSTAGGADTTLVYRICNGQNADGAFVTSTGDLILHLVSMTPIEGFNYYYTSNYHSPEIAFGHAACNGRTTELGCSACLNIASDQIFVCQPPRIGAQVQLQDCRLRFENYPFIE